MTCGGHADRRRVGQPHAINLQVRSQQWDADTSELVGLVDAVRVARPGGRVGPARGPIT
jgi:hypothetical protein